MDFKDEADSQTIQKEILRQKILTKRKERGEEDIDTSQVQSPKYELTPEDIEKRDRRKAQNRKAATKFRNKKKTLLDAKQQERTELIRSNTELESKIAQLSKDLETLKHTLDSHLGSGCCIKSDHNPGSNLNTIDSTNADESRFGSDTPELNPDTPGLYPETSGLIPDTAELNPDTPGLYPDVFGLVPGTYSVIPDASGFVSDTSGLITDTTGCIPDTSGLNPETTKSTNILDYISVSDLISSLSSYDLEKLTNSNNFQPQYQMYTNSAVNDFKMPVASPHYDEFQLSHECCLDNECDLSMTAENEQISMFQTAQPQLSPVNADFEEHLVEPWLPVDESLNQRSFTSL